jgi:hypothetical protein
MKVEIENKDEIKNIIEKCKVKINKEIFVFFTNGNGWYINTLINNLIKSIELKDQEFNKVIIFCSDKDGYDRCKELNFKYFEYVNIPQLKVSELTENKDNKQEHYTRLTFVKIVLISYILELGYTPFYLDPDMSFKTNSIHNLLTYFNEKTEFVCSGTPSYMNSNIMIVKPTLNTNSLFNLQIKDVEHVINTEGLYSDEDFLRPRMQFLQTLNKINFISQIEYPPGCDAKKYIKEAKIIHANCFIGLENKINLIKECNAWYI